MNRNAIIATLLFALLAIPLGAQTPRDSVHAFRQKPRIDSVNLALDAYHRWCNATYTSPLYLKALCPIVKRRPDLRLKPVEDSLLLAPPIPPPPPGPKAAFTFSCASGTITLDGRGSTGRLVSYLWHAAGTDRPDKSGAITQRGWGSTDQPYGETLTVTDSAGLTSAITQTVSCGTTTTPPAIDTTTPPTQPPPSSGTIAAPELPRAVPPSADPYPGRACTTTLSAGVPITPVLAAARGGQVICLTSGATYPVAQLPCRAAGDTGSIVLRTATGLPAEGARMRPSIAGPLAKIVVVVNGDPALSTCPGTFGYFVRGVEITVSPVVVKTYRLVALGDVGTAQDTYAEVPQRLVLSQVWIHGSATAEMQTCAYLNSASTAIVDSWISDCHGKGYDSQAIGSINGPGPFLIRNSYLEGAGENVMFGGATPSIPGLVAADITFQRNHVYTPIAWKGVWTKKNLLELKNAVRVLIEESVFDGSWVDAQSGNALLFKSINDQGTCNWCRTTDVTFRRSYVTHAGQGIVFSGRENYNSFGSVDSTARRFAITDVVFDSLNMGPYTTSQYRGVQIGSGAYDILFDRTVMHGRADDGNQMVLDNLTPSPRTAFRNSVWKHGFYFASGDGVGIGLTAMNASLKPSFEWTAMTVVRGTNLNTLPAGTTVVTSESQAALAAQIRATVTAAVAGVIVPP